MRFFQQNRKKLAVLLMGLCVMGLSLGQVSQAKDLADWDSLSKGQVVIKQNPGTDHEVPSVEAKILVYRPLSKVWTVVSDPEVLMKYDQRVKKVKILSRSGNKQNVEFNVLMTHLLPSFNYVLVQELYPPNLLRFHRLSGSFKDIQGSWKLFPTDNANQTVLSYTLKLDPGPFVPRTLLLGAVKSDLPNMMHNVKLSIEKNTQ